MLPSALTAKLFISFIIIAVGHAATSTNKDDMCSSGSEQSPIDVDTNDVYLVPGAQPIVFINYNKTSLKVMVDDHTVRLTPTANLEVGIAAGGVRGFYILNHIHFHWESEHLFDGNRFPLEAHFVHYNSIYPNVEAALSDPGGIAVIGVLYSEGSENGPLADMILGVEQLKGSNTVKLDVTPSDFLPAHRARFFRYHGSLTTPPCSEAVIWTVMKSKLTLSPDQMAWLKKAPLNKGPLPNNYREVQSIGARDVELWIASYKNKAVNIQTTNYFILTFIIIFIRLLNQ